MPMTIKTILCLLFGCCFIATTPMLFIQETLYRFMAAFGCVVFAVGFVRC
jgi:hypothetical protein